jgi:hypothetical protein
MKRSSKELIFQLIFSITFLISFSHKIGTLCVSKLIMNILIFWKKKKGKMMNLIKQIMNLTISSLVVQITMLIKSQIILELIFQGLNLHHSKMIVLC